MKQITTSSIALLFILQTAIAQINDYREAFDLLKTGHVKESIIKFSEYHKKHPENQDLIYDFACAFATNNDIDSAFHYLRMYVENDYSGVHALNDPDFYFLISDPRWDIIQEIVIANTEKQYGEYQNIELSKLLWKMKIYDQAFYYHIMLIEDSFGFDSPITSALWELKNILNKENLRLLDSIVEYGGWPKESVVKGQASTTAFLIVQHADTATQKRYFPLMEEAANNGELSWSNFALLVDRLNLREGKQQIYGTQIYRNDNGTYYVKDLLEPEYVNQRRESVGLGPIQDYVRQWGIVWDIKQKMK